jgi:hypothetical protein
MAIRAPKDFWAGVMFCGFAVIGILAARDIRWAAPARWGRAISRCCSASCSRPWAHPDRQVRRHRRRAGLALSHSAPRHHRDGGVPVRPYDRTARPRASLAVLTVLSAWAGAQFRLLETVA